MNNNSCLSDYQCRDGILDGTHPITQDEAIQV